MSIKVKFAMFVTTVIALIAAAVAVNVVSTAALHRQWAVEANTSQYRAQYGPDIAAEKAAAKLAAVSSDWSYARDGYATFAVRNADGVVIAKVAATNVAGHVQVEVSFPSQED